jgi:hypothetical protein
LGYNIHNRTTHCCGRLFLFSEYSHFDKLCLIKKRLQIEDVLCIYGYSYYSFVPAGSISAFISLGFKISSFLSKSAM